MTKASDCKCCVCGAQAVAFWPVIDPDIPSHPYCRKCLDKEKLKNALAWRPSTDQIKSVYAAAGVLEQVHEPTDAKNLMALYESLKLVDQCYRIDLSSGREVNVKH